MTKSEENILMGNILSKFLFFVLLIFAFASSGSAATYYVSNQGSDQNDGLSPQTPWATLDRVNKGPFQPGDKILFRRGDFWRGQLKPFSGSEAGHVSYADYGNSAKPLLLGSISKSKPDDWTDEGGNIWSAGDLAVDVGNLIFGSEQACGVRKWDPADLRQNLDFWYDEKTCCVKLRFDQNPAKRYSRIECAMGEHVINEGNRHHVLYENLAVKYGAKHGIGGEDPHHIIVRNCEFSYIGGGLLCWKNGKPIRFGNAIEFWGSTHDNLVEGCRVWEIYDTAMTNQSGYPNTPQYNITYRNNTIWNVEWSFEYWNRLENSETHDIFFLNNTCVNAGGSWAHSQHPDKRGDHVTCHGSNAPARNIVVQDNIFYKATENAFYAHTWPKSQIISSMVLDNNCWYQAQGKMIEFKDASYTMAEFAEYQSECHQDKNSLCAVPKFIDAANRDYRQAPDSPALGMGCQTGENGNQKPGKCGSDSNQNRVSPVP